jgi:hypothetical protein
MKTTCPDEERLADYLEERLSGDERAEIEEHLSDCEICLEEFMVARNLTRHEDRFHTDPAPSKVTKAALHLVNGRGSLLSSAPWQGFKRLVKGLRSRSSGLLSPVPWGSWSLAPIRSSRRSVPKGLIHLRKTFKGVEVEIEIEKTGKDKTLIRVKLPEDARQMKDVRVTLKKDEREISSYLLNRGYVVFEDILFGHYRISFSRGGEMLGEYLFNTKETHHGKG